MILQPLASDTRRRQRSGESEGRMARAVDTGRFSGERPGRGRGFAYDEARHLAAYLYAATLARDRDVLDAGCGTGFGTVMLAETARRVLGIDHSEDAIAVARATYRLPNLE